MASRIKFRFLGKTHWAFYDLVPTYLLCPYPLFSFMPVPRVLIAVLKYATNFHLGSSFNLNDPPFHHLCPAKTFTFMGQVLFLGLFTLNEFLLLCIFISLDGKLLIGTFSFFHIICLRNVFWIMCHSRCWDTKINQTNLQAFKGSQFSGGKQQPPSL